LFKHKLLNITLIIIFAITLVGVTALVVIMKFNEQDGHKTPSADEVVKSSVEIEEITTNLATNDYIKISFTLQADSKKAKEELEKRDFQVRDIIISELSNMKAEQFEGNKGKELLKENIKNRINDLMQEGTVVNVYITSFILQ
jgi:flagellar protein FliL